VAAEAVSILPKLKLLLRNMSNRGGLCYLSAGLRAAAARFSTFAHGFHVGVFAALNGTGFAHVRADRAKLICKSRVPRQQSHACVAYGRALMTKPDAFRHLGRIV